MSQFPNTPGSPSAQSSGSGTLVIVGVIIAAVAVILMNVYVEMRVSAAKEDTVTLFRFNGAIDAGDELALDQFDPVQVPASFVKAFGQDLVREDPDRPGRPKVGIGFKLNQAVIKDEFVRASLFTNKSRRIGRNDPKLGEHQIAISVDSDDQPADLAPGDRIDLYGAIPMSRSIEYMVVMEYVEVAAVGERRQDAGDGTRSNKYGSITININPEQVPLMFDIQRRLPDQEFRISLRAPNDTSTDTTGGEATINEKVLQALRLN